jgi:lipoyl(octanoyl) transferase
VVVVGREGSRLHLNYDESEIETRFGISTRFVGRGGGAVLHAPGQLAVYPIVPLAQLGVSVGEHLDRLQGAIGEALAELGYATEVRAGRRGLWGRSGRLVVIGAAVRRGVSSHGAFVQALPPGPLAARMEGGPDGAWRLGSLVAERSSPVRMGGLREAIVRRFVAAWGGGPMHLFTSHPALVRVVNPRWESRRV